MGFKVSILLSILIATKNRATYCASAIQSILEMDCPDLELVIQDNSDDYKLFDYIKSNVRDKRLKYNYTPPPFSSIDNFNAALEIASGEYVCMIGDDDGINPEIIEVVRWAKLNNIEAVTGNIAANYRWLGTGTKNTFFSDLSGASLTILQFSCRVKNYYPDQSLIRLLKNGATNYSLYDLPKFYHGVVKKECFEKIRCIAGNYLGGLSPDIYSAVALSCVISKAVSIDYPLTIPGVCGQSTSVSEGEQKSHSLNIVDAPHFRDRGNYEWSKDIPPIYCGQTIWADTAIHALCDMQRYDLLRYISLQKLYAQIFALRRPFATWMVKYIYYKNGRNVVVTIVNIFLMLLNLIASKKMRFDLMRFFYRLCYLTKIRRLVVYKDVMNTNDAKIKLLEYLKKYNKHLNLS